MARNARALAADEVGSKAQEVCLVARTQMRFLVEIYILYPDEWK